jgi:hypothetical protein
MIPVAIPVRIQLHIDADADTTEVRLISDWGDTPQFTLRGEHAMRFNAVTARMCAILRIPASSLGPMELTLVALDHDEVSASVVSDNLSLDNLHARGSQADRLGDLLEEAIAVIHDATPQGGAT